MEHAQVLAKKLRRFFHNHTEIDYNISMIVRGDSSGH